MTTRVLLIVVTAALAWPLISAIYSIFAQLAAVQP